jgi:hypothetical protein
MLAHRLRAGGSWTVAQEVRRNIATQNDRREVSINQEGHE